jgi:hypothetical protein
LDFFHESLPDEESPSTLQSLSWGGGVFFRAISDGDENDAIGLYDFSLDGLTWQSSITNDDFSSTHCTYGLQRFVCVRSDTLSWSTTGQQVEHEESLFGYKLNRILFTGERFVAVGRGARRAISIDGQSWESESVGSDPDTYFSIAQSDDVIVAGGGINRYYISYSEDAGESWTDVPYGGCDGNSIKSLAYHNGIFLAQGESNCHHNMHRSNDGINWEPIIELHPFDSYSLLGALNGWFIAQREDEGSHSIYRSESGEDWELVHSLPIGVEINDMAAERWE